MLNGDDVSRIIEMAWEDRTPFEAIKVQFGLISGDVFTTNGNIWFTDITNHDVECYRQSSIKVACK